MQTLRNGVVESTDMYANTILIELITTHTYRSINYVVVLSSNYNTSAQPQ